MPWGERKIPLIPPCSNYTLEREAFLYPFPLSPKLLVAEAGQGYPRSVGLSPCTKLGVCPKWGREGLKPAGSRAKHREVEELSWFLQPVVSVLQLDLL